MEALLHLVWQQRLWQSLRPVGVLEGCDIEVLDVGLSNHHAGPDFFEAKVRIDDITWVGAVEIHQRSSEWLEHQHHLDAAYSGVILHVVEHYDSPIYGYNGRPLPTLVMQVSSELKDRAQYLVEHAKHLPCAPLAERLAPEAIRAHLDELAEERLRQKAGQILGLAEQQGWHEALYITLMRYFGFELNNNAMQTLAESLPYKLLIRYADTPRQFEALLLGQANLLSELPDGEYRATLEEEYRFLAKKHSLAPISTQLWKYARTRPRNFPLRRLLQVGSLLIKPSFSPSHLASLTSLAELRGFLSPQPLSDYWAELYSEGDTPQGLGLSSATLDSLIINIALPLGYAFRLEQEPHSPPEQELRWLRQIKREENRIVRLFARAGAEPRHAADTQALIGLYKQYCTKNKCIYCTWGRKILCSTREA